MKQADILKELREFTEDQKPEIRETEILNGNNSKICSGCATRKHHREFNEKKRGVNIRRSVYCKECEEWYEMHNMTKIERNNEYEEFTHGAF